MKKALDLSLVLACYNEVPIFAESIALILSTLRRSRYAFEVIFVDDGSRDATPSLVAAACKANRECRAVYHWANQGRGKSVADGIRAARGTVVGYIDIDCEVSPVYIPVLTSGILEGKSDVVIGKRMYRTSFVSLVREILSVGYQKLADWAVGTSRLDTETGYKFFRRSKILPLVAKARHPHWFWDTEIMVLARRANLAITEVPVLFLRRTDKQSSVRILSDTLDYLVNLWRLRRRLLNKQIAK